MNKKSRADFQYSIGTLDNSPLLLIWDQNKGNMSVTNDIENVVADIAQAEAICPKEHLIMYLDSEGCWNEWNATTGAFTYVGCKPLRVIFKKSKYRFEIPHLLKP